LPIEVVEERDEACRPVGSSRQGRITWRSDMARVTRRRRSRTGKRGLLLALVALALAQLACDGSDILNEDLAVRERVDGDWIRITFTNPDTLDGEGRWAGGMDEDLVAVIGHAETKVDVAAYDMDLETVADALIAAQRRGVQVRLVTESDRVGDQALTKLEEAGIPVFEDHSDDGLMHHKFIVVDDQWVWTGSWNPTGRGTYRNNNNTVLIASPALAENYTTEFNEMIAGHFGADSFSNTPHPRVIIRAEDSEGHTRSVLVENYFSPDDGVAEEIIAEIRAAEERIRFLAFVFTSEAIVDAMVERSQAGVVVQGVIEERNTDQPNSQYKRLRTAFHDVLTDGNPYTMHHKVIVIDDETVITGSYNFTHSAERTNDENVLIIHDPEVAGLFVEEFGRVYEEAR
jgi:phosphatidylserine/phosphatidylglycerophosphate/cardiolipin synthase-like enzyme